MKYFSGWMFVEHFLVILLTSSLTILFFGSLSISLLQLHQRTLTIFLSTRFWSTRKKLLLLCLVQPYTYLYAVCSYWFKQLLVDHYFVLSQQSIQVSLFLRFNCSVFILTCSFHLRFATWVFVLCVNLCCCLILLDD